MIPDLEKAVRRLHDSAASKGKKRIRLSDIEKNSREFGGTFAASRISEWRSGRARPSLDNMWILLRSLNFDFRDLQDVLDELENERQQKLGSGPEPKTVEETMAGLKDRLRSDPSFREAFDELAGLLDEAEGSADKDQGHG